MSCPVCQSEAISDCFFRPQVPVHQHLLYAKADSARLTPIGDLSICVCNRCGMVYNATFESALMTYGETYDNNQSHSPAFLAHLDERIGHLLTQTELQQGMVLEVGCGNGDFLKRLMAQAGSGVTAWGFDPSYKGGVAEYGGRLRFSVETLEKARLPEHVDAVICRHVIEHISEPLKWLQLLRSMLSPFPNVKLYFETPALEWILAGEVFWDFFYEHCNYFFQESLSCLFHAAGFRVLSATQVFGDQYHWFELALAEPTWQFVPLAKPLAALRHYQEQEKSKFEHWRSFLSKLSQKGPLALWGAGAKGVTLAGLLDPQAQMITALVDLNPQKQGGFLPSTGHPIIAPSQLPEWGIVSALLMNPQYQVEIVSLLQDFDIQLDLVLPI